jgi:hypothetical protein
MIELALQGLAASIVLAVALIAIAVGMFLPPPLARTALILALLALACWPVATAGPRAARRPTGRPPWQSACPR